MANSYVTLYKDANPVYHEETNSYYSRNFTTEISSDNSFSSPIRIPVVGALKASKGSWEYDPFAIRAKNDTVQDITLSIHSNGTSRFTLCKSIPAPADQTPDYASENYGIPDGNWSTSIIFNTLDESDGLNRFFVKATTTRADFTHVDRTAKVRVSQGNTVLDDFDLEAVIENFIELCVLHDSEVLTFPLYAYETCDALALAVYHDRRNWYNVLRDPSDERASDFYIKHAESTYALTKG